MSALARRADVAQNEGQVRKVPISLRWLMRFRRLARRDEYAGQHQRKADDVEQLRALAEKDDRHRRSEHRHDMKEWRGAVGADQLHAAIEAQIGERRGKKSDGKKRQQR